MLSLFLDIVSRRRRAPSPLHVSPQATLRIGKSERTRAAILNAAFDFIWSHPFRDMTVDSVMASTHVGRSAFYQYFSDLRELMQTLLGMVQGEIFHAAEPWLSGVGDPVVLMNDTLAEFVRVCHERGPFLRAISDAASADERFEGDWRLFLEGFDDAATARIEADQKQGLIPPFEARPVAFALNRLDAYVLIQAFGQHPRRKPEPVRKALARIWTSTLYGAEWIGKGSSDLVRT
jgi:AcrR family transcriptional regulator